MFRNIALVCLCICGAFMGVQFRQQTRINLASASPSVYPYMAPYLVAAPEDCRMGGPMVDISKGLRIMVPYHVCVPFENFGPRAALVKSTAFNWRIGQKLPDNPLYVPKAYESAIRPSGNPPSPSFMYSRRQDAVRLYPQGPGWTPDGGSYLWVWGEIEIELLLGERQMIRFCQGWDYRGNQQTCPVQYYARVGGGQ